MITTRPIPVDREIIAKYLPVPAVEAQIDPEVAFASIAMRVKEQEEQEGKAPIWRNVALAQLSEEQMRVMAKEAGVSDLDRLFEAISSRNAHEFARRPLDFLSCVATGRRTVTSGRTAIRSILQLISGCARTRSAMNVSHLSPSRHAKALRG